MQALLVGARGYRTLYGVLLVVSSGGIRRVPAVPRIRRLMPHFLMDSGWQKGGTVVPPCDFHRCSTLIASASRTWLYARERIAPAPPCEHARKPKRYPNSTRESSTYDSPLNRSNPNRLSPYFPQNQQNYTT